MTGLGCRQRCRDRLKVSQLTHENDIGILSQYGAQSMCKRFRVLAQLALNHDTLAVLEQKLDRVLDRNRVHIALLVDLVDHRRERRGLAMTGWPRYEHKALLQLDE